MPIFAFAIFITLIAATAEARETAKVLPAGIHRARLVGVVTSEVKDTLNESGQAQGLTHSLNRTVTVSDMAARASAADQAKLNSLISGLNSLQPGLGNQLAGSPTNLYSDMSVNQQVMLAAFERGITDRFSVGIRAPIVKRSIRHSFRVQRSGNAASIQQMMGTLSPEMSAGLATLAGMDTAYFESSLFTSKGYEAPTDFEKTQLGDVEFGGKWNFLHSDHANTTAQLGAAAPTGAKSSLRNPFDKGNSREAWSYAVQLFQEIYPARGLTFGAASKLGYSFKDTRERAVPKSADDSLPSLLPADGQVQNVTRQRGYQWESEASAYYRLPGEMFGFWGAYQYGQKGKDSFKGPGNLYYAGLEKGTDWKVQSGELGAEVSMISAFRKGRFAVPMEVSLLYNKTLAGKNTPLSSYTRLDLMVYF